MRNALLALRGTIERSPLYLVCIALGFLCALSLQLPLLPALSDNMAKLFTTIATVFGGIASAIWIWNLQQRRAAENAARLVSLMLEQAVAAFAGADQEAADCVKRHQNIEPSAFEHLKAAFQDCMAQMERFGTQVAQLDSVRQVYVLEVERTMKLLLRSIDEYVHTWRTRPSSVGAAFQALREDLSLMRACFAMAEQIHFEPPNSRIAPRQ